MFSRRQRQKQTDFRGIRLALYTTFTPCARNRGLFFLSAHVTPRFVRHFNVIGYVDMSDDDKRLIFRTILDNFLSSGFEGSLARSVYDPKIIC